MVSINCVVIGDSMVGKTSLLARQTSNKFNKDYIPTVFIDHFNTLSHPSKKVEVNLDLWDTPGQEGPDGLKALSNLEIDVCLICFSIMSPDSFENVSWRWHKEVKHFFPNAVAILVGTMQDLINDKIELAKLQAANQLPKTYIHGKELAKKIDAIEYCECSAFTGQGVKNVFEKAVHAVLRKRTDGDKLQKDCLVM